MCQQYAALWQLAGARDLERAQRRRTTASQPTAARRWSVPRWSSSCVDLLTIACPSAGLRDKVRLGLERAGIELVSADGERFDPAAHQALGEVEPPSRLVGTIAATQRSGYRPWPAGSRSGRSRLPSTMTVTSAEAGPAIRWRHRPLRSRAAHELASELGRDDLLKGRVRRSGNGGPGGRGRLR